MLTGTTGPSSSFAYRIGFRVSIRSGFDWPVYPARRFGSQAFVAETFSSFAARGASQFLAVAKRLCDGSRGLQSTVGVPHASASRQRRLKALQNPAIQASLTRCIPFFRPPRWTEVHGYLQGLAPRDNQATAAGCEKVSVPRRASHQKNTPLHDRESA